MSLPTMTRQTSLVLYDIKKKKKKTHLFSDLLPDDARHLITIEFDNWVVHHDLLFWKGGEGTIECGLQK